MTNFAERSLAGGFTALASGDCAQRAQVALEIHDPDTVRSLVEQLELAVASNPAAAFELDATGCARLRVAAHDYEAGRFYTPSLAELRAELATRSGAGSAPVELYRLEAPDLGVGWLQAVAAPETLFQVASQFDCLEAPSACVVRVADYFSDPTQGPRALVSAFPATLLRHYHAPRADGSRFTQRDGDCLNLLSDVFDERVASVECGYLQTQGVHDAEALLEALTRNFDAIRVGLHAQVQVVLGARWYGRVSRGQRIAQAFTSTIALGGYSHGKSVLALDEVCRLLLRGAYLGTLLGALQLEQRRVVLTLIGGGVFGNPRELIWEAIEWATERARPLAARPLQVLVNEFGARSLRPELPTAPVC